MNCATPAHEPRARILFGGILLTLVACQGSLEGDFPARMGQGSGGQGTGGSASGGSGTGGSASGGSSGGCDAVAMVLKPSCATKSCHATALDVFPNLGAADVGAMVKVTKAMALCPDELLANPSDPMQSVLYKVIAGRDCGDQMPSGSPFDGDQLTSSLACMADWIAHL